MKIRAVSTLATLLLSIAYCASAYGAFEQWQYWATADPGQIYTTEKDAAAHMRSLGNPALGQNFTIRGPITYMARDQVTRAWYAPNKPPYYLDEWQYTGSSTPKTSESAAVQEWYDATVAIAAPCAITQFDVSGTWDVQTSYLSLPTRMWKTITINTQGKMWNGSSWVCLSPGAPWTHQIRADRQAQCPSFYAANIPLQTCTLSGARYTDAKPCLCVKERGNPCDVGTGTKLIRETDYTGPGIEFTRILNSQSEVSWSNSFSTYFIPDGSTAIGLVTADGHHEPFASNGSGQYISYTGSGTEARLESGEWAIYYPSGAKDYFNTSGRLLRRKTPTGQVTTINRNTGGQIVSIVGPFGHTLTLQYTSAGDLERLIDPAGEDILYTYDSARRLVTVTYQDGSERDYHYENSNFDRFVTGITDENGARYATYTYDSGGRASVSEHAGGFGGVTLAYSTSSTAVTDAEGNVATYNFTTDQYRMRKITSASLAGGTRTYAFPSWAADYQQRPTQLTDENGVVTKYTFDAHHKTSETQAFGTPQQRILNYTYLDLPSDRLTLVTSPSVKAGSLRQVATTYNGSSLPTVITVSGYKPSGAAVSRSTTFSYNSYGQVIEIDGPRTDVSDVTTMTYFACTTGAECGQLESVTNALGHATTYDSYDDHGRLTQMTDPNGVVTAYVYDLRGRTISITKTPPSGPVGVTSYSYDDAGQLETAQSPNGAELTYGYDDAHNLTSIADGDGNRIEYGYDLNGNRTAENIYDVSESLKKTVEYTYDARDRIDTINAAGSLTDRVFDALGNLTDETDPNSNDTEHDYDALNRLKKTIDALSGETDYVYDTNDFLTSVEAPNGATTSSVYDDLGNLLSTISPDTGTTTYTYDAAGNRLSQTDANSVTVSYAYDALNRLTDVDYPGSTLDVDLAYDQGTNQKGPLTTMVDGSGTTTFSYDVYGNLTQESKVIDGHTHVTGYAYDAADLLESISYPSGRTVDYTRNTLGQVAAVETTYDSTTVSVADDIAYEPFGPLSALTFGNGLALSRTFDQQYRLTAQTTGTIQNLAFTLDAAGNIDEIADGVNGSLSQDFTQDALHRIDSEGGGYGSNDYAYDANGNRLTRVHGGTTQTLTYTANSNRLATHNGNTVSRDAAGNTMADPTENVSFSYGSHNRVVAAYAGGTLKASYVYNGHGQRAKKVETTGAQRTIVYHYGLGGELLGETVCNSAGDKIGEREYAWLDSLPLAQSERVFSSGVVTNSQFVYVHADQLNTPRLATSGSQTVVWRWDSDAFGIGAANTDPDSDTNLVDIRLRFPGQYLDEETGLHYNYYRDYDAVTGRYVQSDPIGLAGGLNTYAYVGGNPLSRSDPLGLQERAAPGGYTFPNYTSPWPPGSTINTLIHDALIDVVDTIVDWCTDDEPCPPCMTASGRVVPVGTIAYRPLETPPLGKIEHGIAGPHYNIYVANQAPRNSPQPCKCFWQPQGAVPPSALPPGAIPIEPFVSP